MCRSNLEDPNLGGGGVPVLILERQNLNQKLLISALADVGRIKKILARPLHSA